MRGDSGSSNISDAVIKSLFEDIKGIDNLGFCGGETLLSLDRIQKIMDVIIENHIQVNQFGLITNGTLYSQQVDDLFTYFNQYVQTCKHSIALRDIIDEFDDINILDNHTVINKLTHLRKTIAEIQAKTTYGYIILSSDDFHEQAINQLPPTLKYQYIKNIRALTSSLYFSGPQHLDRIFNEGYAKDLDNINKQDIEDNKYFVLNKKDTTFIGPIVFVNIYGQITNCNYSYQRQSLDNHGSIMDNHLVDIIEQTDPKKCLSKRIWNKEITKEIIKLS